MAAGTSKWTTLGSNTDVTVNNDTGSEPNVNVALGTAIQVRHECHMWLDATGGIRTEDFDWFVNGDFTVALNATKLNITNTIGDCTVKIIGSVDGENYFDLATLGTTTVDNAVVAYVYDYDAKGRAPHMKLELTPETGVDNTATPIKIVITPH